MANIINKIFGSKKSEYFLEFDDIKDNKVVEKITETVSDVAEKVTETAKKVADEAPDKAAKATGKVLDAADKVTETSGREAKNVDETNIAKKEANAAKAKTKKSDQPKTNPPEPDLTESTIEKPAPQKELPPLNSIQKTPEGMTFSTDYLLPKSNGSRRRPGPSLKMFKDMARDVGRR
ncbi:MAG: hypothetical protein WBA77_02740 [Microcoleaceae cyanobacterium]